MTREEAIKRLEVVRTNALIQKANGASEYWQEEIDGTIEAIDMAIEALSADAVQGYTEWLEKIIVDNEGANEWLCEDTPDLEWCEKNCHYSSIQAECLRHLYEVSKGGAEK